jgi:hypothetical protein
MRKNILIVVESIDVEDSSGAKANIALIENLHKIGYNIQVYHYTRKDVTLQGIHCVAIKENRFSILFFLSRLERHLRNSLKIKLNSPLEKLFGFSFTLFNDRNSIITALRKIENFKPDLVLTLSQGGRFRPHHALVKMPELHKKWMAYIHDPYPMHLYPRPFAWVEAGYFQKWKFILEISEKAKFKAFPSKLLREWMGSYYPGFLTSSVVIPHQLLEASVEVVDFPSYFNPDNFNLLHAGTLLQPRNPKILVKAFLCFLEKFPEARPHSKLIFIGGENIYSHWLKEKASEMKELEISDSYVPFREVLNMQQNSAVNIILEAKSEISPFLPGKFPHCVLADKPILLLGPYYSETKRLLGQSYPYWSENDDLAQITQGIESLYLQWRKSSEDLKLNRPDLEAYLSITYLKEVLDDILLPL